MQNEFINNTAGTGGGAIGTLNDTLVTITQNLFVKNSTLGLPPAFPELTQPLGGGAIGDYGSRTVSITDNVFAEAFPA